MFNATIEFKEGSTHTFENTESFMQAWYQMYNKKQDLWDLADVSNIINGGIISQYDIFRIRKIFKDKTNVERIIFNVYQVKVQHKEIRVYCLSKAALTNFMRMAVPNTAAIHGGATYYNDGHVWEVSKTTLEV